MIQQTCLSNLFVRCYILLFLSYYCLPAVHYRISYVPMAVASAVMIGLLFWITHSSQVQQMVRKILVRITCCAILYYIIPYSMTVKPALNEFQQMVMFSAPMVISYSVISIDDYKSARIIAAFCLFCLLLVMLKTGIALQEYATVCRALASGSASDVVINQYRMGNVGGLGFAYSMGPLCFLSFFEARQNSGKVKWLYAAICCCTLFFIFKTQYTTLLILSTSFMLLMLLKEIKPFPLKFLAFSVVIFGTIFIQPIVETLATVTLEPLPVLSHHFSDLSNYLGGDELSSSRGDRALNTLDIFYRNPLIGFPGCMTDPYTRDIILEAHSGSITILTQIGIIGFACYMAYFWCAWKSIRNIMIWHGCKTLPFDISVLYLVAFGFVNVIGQIFELSMIVFLFVPLTSYCLQKRKLLHIR